MIRKLLESLFPSLLIRRANRYSTQLEQDTGFSLRARHGEDGWMFFLIEPGESEPSDWQDWWSSLDDAIFDLSNFDGGSYD